MNNPFRSVFRRLPLVRNISALEQQNHFLLAEVRKLNETLRSLLSLNPDLRWNVERQTTASFDYQWNQIPDGKALPSDSQFMNSIADHVVRITGLPADWFPGKRVLDAGCGIGRFSYGLLKLGAVVTSADQSEWACKRTRELCSPFAERSHVVSRNLLNWAEPDDFDLVFCFGVVHHTGRTYRAIENLSSKVRPGGHFFLMVYGFPTESEHFGELNSYEDLREELRALTPAEKYEVLARRFGRDLAHGYFDAVSPKINELLTFEELREMLQLLGFTEVRRTLLNRNHHLVTRRALPAAGAPA